MAEPKGRSSSQETLGEIKAFVEGILDTLGSVAQTPDAQDGARRLFFPRGITEIFAKITIGEVQTELRISGDQIHAVSPPQKSDLPDQFVHPTMFYHLSGKAGDPDVVLFTKAGAAVPFHPGVGEIISWID